nr:hypothetical protein [Tanacetum cinerariifolium]
MFIQPHDPDYVPEPMYPEYIALEDKHVLLAEEQPLPPIVSPIAESPEYVTELDREEDPEEYEDDEMEDGLVDYPMDGGDDGDEIAPMTVEEVNTRVTELVELHEHDTQDLYALLEDAQDSRTRISQQVAMDSQRVDLLMEDRIAHQETILIVKEEAYATEIAELRETDRRHQAHMPRRARQLGGDARVLDHQDAPRDADSHI